MLLVVAIIVILIGMLLPALSRLRHSTSTTVCKSNLTIIYQATNQYSIIHQGRLPASRAWVGGDWKNINSVRGGTLYSYMGGNEGAYICPVFVSTPRSIWASGHVNGVAAFTYSLNEYMGNDWGGHKYMKIQQADEPEKLCMFTDENPWTIPGLSTYTINNGAMGVGRYNDAGHHIDAIGSYHEPPGNDYKAGSSNVMFADGHVGLVHVSQSKEVVTPRRWK